jgi:hypothetical protein
MASETPDELSRISRRLWELIHGADMLPANRWEQALAIIKASGNQIKRRPYKPNEDPLITEARAVIDNERAHAEDN